MEVDKLHMSLPVITLPIQEQEDSAHKSNDETISSTHESKKYDLLSEIICDEEEEQEERQQLKLYNKEVRSPNTIMQVSLSNSILEANSSYAYLWQSNEERNAHDVYVLEEMEKLVKQLCHRLCAVLKESCYIHCASEMSHELLCEDNIAMLSHAGLLNYFKNVNYEEYLQYIQRVSHTDGTQLARTFVMCMTDRLVNYFLELYINPLIRHLREIVMNNTNTNILANEEEVKEFVEEEEEEHEHHHSKKSAHHNNNSSSDNKHADNKSREPVSTIVFDEYEMSPTDYNNNNNNNNKKSNTNNMKRHSKHKYLEVSANENEEKMENEPLCVIDLNTTEWANHISVSDNGEVDGFEQSDMLYSSCEGNAQNGQTNSSHMNYSTACTCSNKNNYYFNEHNIQNKKVKHISKLHDVKLQSVEPFAFSSPTTTTNTTTTNTTLFTSDGTDNVNNTSTNDEELLELKVWNEIKDNIARMLNMQERTNTNEIKESKHTTKHHHHNNSMENDTITNVKEIMFNSIVYSLESVLRNREWHDMYNSVLRYTFAQLYLRVVKHFGLILRLKLMEHYDGDGNEYNYMNSDNVTSRLFKNTSQQHIKDNNNCTESNDEAHRIAECINILNDVLRDCIDEHYHNSATQLNVYLKQQRVWLMNSIHKYHEYQLTHHQHICNTCTNNKNKCNGATMMIIDEVFTKEMLIYNIWNKSSSDNYHSSVTDSNCNANTNNNISNEQNKLSGRNSKREDGNYEDGEENDGNSESDSRYIHSSSGSRGRLNYKLSSASSILDNNNNNNNNNNSNNNKCDSSSTTVSQSVIINDKLESASFSGDHATAPLLLNYWLQNLNHVISHEENDKHETNSIKQSKQSHLPSSSTSSSSNSIINGAKVLDLILGEFNYSDNNIHDNQKFDKNNKINDKMNAKVQNCANHCVLEHTAEDAKLYDLLTSSAVVRIRSLQKLIHANANRLLVALMTDRLAVLFREKDICDKLHLPEIKLSETLKHNIDIINIREKEKLKGGKWEVCAHQISMKNKEVQKANTEVQEEKRAGNIQSQTNVGAKANKETKNNFQGHLFMASTSSLLSARSSITRTRNSSVASNIVLRHMFEKDKLESKCLCVLM